MKITILNGDIKNEGSDFSEFIVELSEKFKENHTVSTFDLNKMNLHYCIGCWTCWWKTPGLCAINDDAELINRAVVNSDFIIFASPLIAGFTSSSLKKVTDRFVGLLHPYIKLVNGECHHLKRYAKYPYFGLVLKKESDTDNEDIKIINDIYDRFAINFHSKKKYTKFIEENNIEDIIYETCNI
jgi:multimeric flavodoxin WrbA